MSTDKSAAETQAAAMLLRHVRRLGYGDVSVFPAGWARRAAEIGGETAPSPVDAALDICRSVLTGDAQGSRLILELADNLRNADRPDIAALVLDELLDSDSHVRGAAEIWAESCLRAGRIEAALEGFALAAAEKPKKIEPLEKLVGLLLKLDRRQQAVPWLRRWCKLDSDNSAAKMLLEQCLGLRRPAPTGLPDDVGLLDSLYRIPVLAALDFNSITCTKLTEGNTNAVYRLDSDLGAFVLRLGKYPRQRWNTFWEERFNMGLAHAQGLAPPILFMDAADGVLLTPFVEGRRGGRMENPEFLDRAADFFTRLHDGPAFQGRYNPLEALDWREERIQGIAPDWAPDLEMLRGRMTLLRSALDRTSPGFAPCHNDPVTGNFIDSVDGLMMIDWQTAAMADPDAEIGAFLARIGRQDGLRDGFLARAYGDAGSPRAHRARLWELLARYIVVVEAVQMGVDSPGDAGWAAHGAQARADLAAMIEAGALKAGLTALQETA